jgi:excisionase family DNA binding protein
MERDKSDDTTPDEVLTTEGAAELLKVHKSWIYERTRRGTIPHRKIGKYLRFSRKELLEWFDSQVRTGR